MQRLSMIASTAFVVLALSGAAFMKKPVAPSSSTEPTAKTFENSYYWYSAFDGSYNDYETTSYEIWEMEIYYDVTVNTTPYPGGTLLEKGYQVNNPNFPAMVFLYGHF